LDRRYNPPVVALERRKQRFHQTRKTTGKSIAVRFDVDDKIGSDTSAGLRQSRGGSVRVSQLAANSVVKGGLKFLEGLG
jgi:hypothetical protein